MNKKYLKNVLNEGYAFGKLFKSSVNVSTHDILNVCKEIGARPAKELKELTSLVNNEYAELDIKDGLPPLRQILIDLHRAVPGGIFEVKRQEG
jgi:hypothetical protein